MTDDDDDDRPTPAVFEAARLLETLRPRLMSLPEIPAANPLNALLQGRMPTELLQSPSAAIAEAHEKAHRNPPASSSAVAMARGDFERSDLAKIYRAMADLAPPTYRDDLAQAYSELELRLGDAIVERHEKDARIAALEAENAEAYGYLKRLFQHMAPQCTPLPDLLGVCTQVDNGIAGLKIENAALRAAQSPVSMNTAYDIPGQRRRPDGTMAPQAKPLPVLKPAGDPRRIGG